MRIGYVRVSTREQNEDLQIAALKKEGCEMTFIDKGVSGAKTSRPELDKMLTHLRRGDALVIWKLDRLGRSLKHLIEMGTMLQEKGIDLISCTEKIDTTTPMGKLMFHFMAALAEFERDLIRESTNAGLVAARERGHLGGRPQKLTSKQVTTAQRLYNAGTDIETICKTVGCGKTTLYRYIQVGKREEA